MSTCCKSRSLVLPRAGAIAVFTILVAGCATIAALSSAGTALQEAGFEVHDLMMQQDDSVYADLERHDGATEVEHVEAAARIIWDHLEGKAQQVEIRLRNPDDVDSIVTYSAEELEAIHGEASRGCVVVTSDASRAEPQACADLHLTN